MLVIGEREREREGGRERGRERERGGGGRERESDCYHTEREKGRERGSKSERGEDGGLEGLRKSRKKQERRRTEIQNYKLERAEENIKPTGS